MFKLRFDENRCLDCESCDCLTKCQYMEMDAETARCEMQKIIAGQDSPVLRNCATCYACEEYCSRGNHPFYLIVRQQEALGLPPLPEPIIRRGVQMAIPFRGEPLIQPIRGTALNMGVFSTLSHLARGRLFEGLTLISTDPRKMFHYFCQLMYLHYGRISVINERLGKTIQTIAAHKADQVIHFHDECYGTYTSYAPAFGIDVPFRSVHLFEYLYDRLTQLKDDIKPLNYKVAYQRPCSSRLSPDKHAFVNKIFGLVGVEHVQRRYMDQNALCCGGTITAQKRDGSRRRCLEIQHKNIEDMQQAGAQLCIFNCPACMQTLGKKVAENGIMPLFMSDLCRLAIGEKTALT
ncbi:MAG: (Fe-S)-binding protein [Desulfobacteraceae bacterium]|nr:MAG: (Fe-S)-binding protein [Desulfobacteraceae bacterium]